MRSTERGFSLVLCLAALAVLVLVASTGLLVAGAGIRSTRNARGAAQAHFVAESAVSEALQRINGPGIVHFQNDVEAQWATMWGPGSKPFVALPGFSYTATATASPADPASAGRIVAIADGGGGARNVVVANVVRSNVPATAPGAIYLASDAQTDATFDGNAFLVDGNDRNFTGGAGPAAPVPGLSTRNETNTQEALTSLSGGQDDNVQGLGYSAGPPITPSVRTSPAAPSTDQLNQMAADLLLRPHVTNGASQINGNATFGTVSAPQITHFPQSTEIKGNGNASGAGILIVDGDLTIKGTLDFKGLIIVRGRTQVIGDTSVTGNATVYGSLWTNDINLVVGGSAIVQYSTEALALANQVGGGGALPAPVRVTSLADCAVVPAATSGCP